MNQATLAESSTPNHSSSETGTDKAPLWQFDDEALERALKAVHWNERDVSNFLRGTATR